jgi:hypothetical protein
MTATTKHAPAPWQAHAATPMDKAEMPAAMFVIRDANGWSLAHLCGVWKDTQATAELMARAPALRAALESIIEWTGEENPPAAQRLMLIRNAARAALEGVSAEEYEHAKRNIGKPWTAEEDEALKADFAKGLNVPAIAKARGRTIAGIEARLERHELIDGKAKRLANAARALPARNDIERESGRRGGE